MITALIAITLLQSPQHVFRIEALSGPRLITLPQVQIELGISRDEAYQFVNDNAHQFNVIQLGRSPVESPEKVRRTVDELVFSFPKKHRNRLQELYFQVYGASSIMDSQAAKLLGTRPQQKADVQALYNRALVRYVTERGKVWAKIPKSAATSSPLDATSAKANPVSREVQEYLSRETPKLNQLWESLLNQCRTDSYEILDARQKSKLKKLMGKPMKESVRNPYRVSLFFATQIYTIRNP